MKLYMRVQDQAEICVGTAQSMQDVPRLLEEIAALWRGRYLAEKYIADDHDHNPTQHRDHRPPWCNTCRRDGAGQSVAGAGAGARVGGARRG